MKQILASPLRPHSSLLVLLAALVLVLGISSPAHAHANLLQTTPSDGSILEETPSQLLLQYSEPLELELIDVNLYDWNGENIPLPKPQLVPGDAAQLQVGLPDLERGTYTALVQVVSEDGHPIRDRFAFSVEEVTPGVSPYGIDPTDKKQEELPSLLLLLTRYLAEGLLLIGGGFYALAHFARRFDYPSAGQLLGRSARWLWALLLVLTLAEGAAYFNTLTDGSLLDLLASGEWTTLFASSFARMLAVQLLLLLLLALPNMAAVWPVLVWTLLVGSLAFGGHAWGIEPVWAALTLRIAHVLSLALWLGALFYLLAALGWERRGGSTANHASFRKLCLTLLLSAAVLAAVTGILMVNVQTDWSLVLQQALPWSTWLIGKLVLFALMLVLAFIQTRRWRINYKLLSRNLLRVELLVAVLVVLAAVVMSQIEYPLP